MVDVEIRDNMIRLGQFVKLAGAVESGACLLYTSPSPRD